MTESSYQEVKHENHVENQDSKPDEPNSNTSGKLSLPWIFPFKRPKFYLPRIRVGIPQPPRWLYALLIFLSIYYVFSGGVYLLVEENVLAYLSHPDGSVEMIYTRSGSCSGNTSHQYVFEGLVAGILMFLGALGLYLIYEGSKQPHDPDRAFNFQVVGIILVILAVLIIENMMNIKGCVPPEPPEGG